VKIKVDKIIDIESTCEGIEGEEGEDPHMYSHSVIKLKTYFLWLKKMLSLTIMIEGDH